MKNDPLVYEKLHKTALNAPKLPGVYLWHDENDDIIYVGKAKVLKNRLSSYFSGNKDIKTKILVSKAFRIEYITTDNEYEALILENNLIKQHSPKYNIDLKDDKSYPCLCITKEDFPRIFATRRILKDGSKYFGPFPNAGALTTYIENLHKQYKLRHCKKFRIRNSPCMYYHIGRCAAPCCKKIDKQTYSQMIGEILSFLEGNPSEKIKKLQQEMKEEAKALNFEKAARIRDGIQSIQLLHSKNSVMDFNFDSRDYIGFAAKGTMVSFSVLKMREGRLVFHDLYRTKSINDESDLMLEFLLAYYSSQEVFPQQIYLPSVTENSLFKKYSNEEFGCSPELINIDPQADTNNINKIQHNHISAMKMAYQNAYEDLLRRIREHSDIPSLIELKKIMNMEKLPVRIEGFDIAHIAGKFPVASLISFYNGNPDKKNYRYFRLKTTEGIIDDFASMREAAARRYTRLINEKKELPDLILIDGGIGQVNAVQGILDTLDLKIPIVGLAEKNEDIYFPNRSKPLRLPKQNEALKLLQRIRDECHRFATSRNQELRTKENTIGNFTKLAHVGKKRAAILTAHYGTLQALVNSVQGIEINDKENPGSQESKTPVGLKALAETIFVTEEQASEIYQSAQILLSEEKEK